MTGDDKTDVGGMMEDGDGAVAALVEFVTDADGQKTWPGEDMVAPVKIVSWPGLPGG